jgi:hypothetical protein
MPLIEGVEESRLVIEMAPRWRGEDRLRRLQFAVLGQDREGDVVVVFVPRVEPGHVLLHFGQDLESSACIFSVATTSARIAAIRWPPGSGRRRS